MKVTNLSLKQQIKLVTKTQTLCNEIISLKYTKPQQRDTLMEKFLSNGVPLKRDLKQLQKISTIELRKETSKLKRRFISLEKSCSQLSINMNDIEGNRLDIYKLKTKITQKKSKLIKSDTKSELNKISADYLPLTNQTEVVKLLNLSEAIVKHLRDTNILKFRKINGRVYFNHKSIKEFQESFNLNDYITVGKCKEILELNGYYDECVNKMAIPYFDFSITVEKMINADKNKGKLETIKFGTTVFISKKSMNTSMAYLKKLDRDKCGLGIALEPTTKGKSNNTGAKGSRININPFHRKRKVA